jgi:hypothetical protein
MRGSLSRKLLPVLIRSPKAVIVAAHAKGIQCRYHTEARPQNPSLGGDVLSGGVDPRGGVTGIEMIADNPAEG